MRFNSHRAVGLFSNRSEAEAALIELSKSGFDMDKVSVVNKNSDTEKIEGIVGSSDNSNDRVADSAGTGAKVGGIGGGALGIIAGLGILAIPGIGPVAEIATVLANAVLGSAIGVAGGGLVGALVGWGLPEDKAKYYDERVHSSGDYLVMAEGNDSVIQAIQTVFANHNVRDWEVFRDPEHSTGTPLTTPSTAPVDSYRARP